MRLVVKQCERLAGELRMPGDKSVAHRVLILGALADGAMRIRGLPQGGDVASTRRCLEALGAGFVAEAGGLRVVPPDSWRRDVRLDCGNSGTTTRLLAGVLAGLGVPAVLDGDASLRRRPMSRVTEPLARLGARVTSNPDGLLPLRIEAGDGPLRGARIDVAVASAQVKSAILLAGLFAEGETTVVEPAPTRDHTERLLAAMGADVRRDGLAITVRGNESGANLRGLDLDLPGDISTAAFFLVAATLVPDARVTLRGVGTNPTRTGVLDALAAMGARIKITGKRDAGGEPVADLTVKTAPLRATTVEGALVPRLIDELPVLAVLATQAWGTTLVRDAAELRHKESDRIATTVSQLRQLGAEIDEHRDGFSIHGPTPLHGGEVTADGDHRLAMALAVAGLVATGETVITGAEAAAVSYPAFWEDLAQLAGPGIVRTPETAA
ncbi:MAG TPA: 3-phosphoshikimate 1-carboxyvinyltransferase [Candidatus Krumholzibacteria bacterium]|nr:3-phosphoshikimate 1-carboxyvinyltransferase [Candidatus Krumholzibacteria bacterium]HPD72212.1 3-phosphoshikimate 1-carboxyvinyltransferase [Candidatus Krumholzibacteria bacterium]HRY40856.1 3-phosphoshikimate 1-carboxyvinyltransferase [Candidatus Krumholzibacteria bacterium]